MGSFSWNKADKLTRTENIVYGAAFRFLIPEEFGGGFIKDHYQDYGYLGEGVHGGAKYDMYELLAFWNDAEDLRFHGEKPLMKEIDELTAYNRLQGIHIGCYDKDILKLKYPLKLVSPSCKQTYEQVKDPSLGDPDQGFFVRYRPKVG